jgi:predicted metalloendopeptidase
MAKVFKSTPVEVWQDFLAVRLLRNNSALMTQELDDATFQFTSTAITGAKQQRERWKRGVQLVNGTMGMAVGKIYVDRYFTPEAKERVDQLVQNLIVAMGERIDGLTWMSAETKKAAHVKLSKFTVKIGYPEKWRDYKNLKVAQGDLMGNIFRARGLRIRLPAGQAVQAGGPQRVVHVTADGERVLQPADERDRVPGRHPAASVLRCARG